MDGRPVDEEREEWVGAEPMFRLFVFSYEAGSYHVEAFDHWCRDVTRLISDAGYYYTDSGKLWSLALIHEGSRGADLTWLSGYDYRIAPRTFAERQSRRDMQTRYLAARSQDSKPVVLPDGLRVIRMFPEWGGAGPLWESFTDNYPADPRRLGLSRGLAAELEAWNEHWGSRHHDEPLADPDRWLAEGVKLHADVQRAMADRAEVAAEFLPHERQSPETL
ncbi:hypothetical protein VX037_09300 [Gordonia sp. Z-3]|jgi:hypothetical protein|uniref:hypothetical protein n=1 Tax=Gordonia sp. Z-3 TaxID=3115408 RepID=UPI002E2B9CEF|nr:hypothetical protein [Gordonia sp. Z-3]MED5801218.1 hypothetical protein [Gordonia sp. Z-3]